jgi:hypothetical protein
VHAMRARIRLARGDVAGALSEDALQAEVGRAQDLQGVIQAAATTTYIQAVADDLEAAAAAFDELLRRWGAAPQAVAFTPVEVAYAARLLGRDDEFLAVAEEGYPTAWLTAAIAFARGAHSEAARVFDRIGSLPNAAYARLVGAEARHAGASDDDLQQAIEFYRSVRATLFLRRAEALLAAAG